MAKQKFNPSMTDLLDELKTDIFKSLNCVNVGVIQAFDAANQTATIKLSIKSIVKENADGTRELKERPLLLECPCVVLTGGGSSIRMPIAAGDFCLVLFNDRDIDNWFVAGDGQVPNTYRTHDLSDAFALVGIYSLQNALSDWVENQITVYYDADNNIELKSGRINAISPEVYIGNADFEFICKSLKLKDWISNEIDAKYNSHTHTITAISVSGAVLVASGVPATATGVSDTPSPTMTDPTEADLASTSHKCGD